MRQTFNFSAGPATLPEPVLRKAADEMLNWHGSDQSVMEMSHRGEHYMAIHADAKSRLRSLMNIPESHEILFLQGGATQQFAMIPMNLLSNGQSADYVNTGQWSKKAIAAAGEMATINVAASSESDNFCSIPPESDWSLDPKAAYAHFCVNETIGGVEFFFTPDTGNVPLVADISSTFLSRPIDVARYGLIYGGAQKNIGPAGMAIVIIRQDLLEQVQAKIPAIFSYRAHAKADSMLNTPPTYSIYIAGLVFEWLQEQGGVEAIERQNIEKSSALYQFIDQSAFYANPVDPQCRSRMNVPFTLADSSRDKNFLDGAVDRNLIQLKGHRSVGGMRASIYNAMPVSGVTALIDYMREFERTQA